MRSRLMLNHQRDYPKHFRPIPCLRLHQRHLIKAQNRYLNRLPMLSFLPNACLSHYPSCQSHWVLVTAHLLNGRAYFQVPVNLTLQKVTCCQITFVIWSSFVVLALAAALALVLVLVLFLAIFVASPALVQRFCSACDPSYLQRECFGEDDWAIFFLWVVVSILDL